MLKPALKYVWRNFGIRDKYLDVKYQSLLKEWQRDKAAPAWPRPVGEPVVLIIPPDPALLTSSKGDEAMIGVTLAHFRNQWPNVRFLVATAGDEADANARRLNTEPVRALDEQLSLRQSLALLEGRNLRACVTIGADVLDGSYSQEFSGKLLMLTGMLARRGVETIVTGFSVSERPYPKLRFLLDEFTDDVVFNLRDPVSFSRFKMLTGASANLVADVAFLLQPQHDSEAACAARQWCETQRAAGRKVIGLNLHPLLLDLKERHNIHRVVANFIQVTRAMIRRHDVSVVLLDHDFRGDSADYHCLDLVEQELREELPARVFRSPVRLSAAELKAVASYLDGIVSGRMHLMIASCGAGTPVFGIEYKGKMGGLMKHFQLDVTNLSNAAEIMDVPEVFSCKLDRFIDNLDLCRQQLLDNRAEIHRLASLNFARLG